MTGEMNVLDRTGDSKIIWDRNNSDEVDAARDTFDKLKKKGFIAYSVRGERGDKGEILHKFDANAERIIMSPASIGG
jgi:hypothetical protein